MSQAWYFQCPTTIVHGVGAASKVGEHARAIGGTRALVVTDPGVARTPHLSTVTASLAAAGLYYDVFDRVEPDPSTSVVEDNVERVKSGRFDVLVALGGGSSIDVAKGFRLLSQLGGRLRDYAPGDKIPVSLSLPLIAISTTAGTGSQVSFGAVFSDLERKTKFAVVSPKMAPTIALNDPLVTIGAPKSVVVNAGMDALTHAIESFISVNANPLADILALEAIGLISRNFPIVANGGQEIDAWDAMLLASTIAILAGTNTGLGMCHAVAMPICTMYSLPHGLVVGTMLALAMEYNLEVRIERLARVAEVMGAVGAASSREESARRAISAVRGLSQQLGLPARLRELGVSYNDLSLVARLTMESFQAANNPRSMTVESVEDMLKVAF